MACTCNSDSKRYDDAPIYMTYGYAPPRGYGVLSAEESTGAAGTVVRSRAVEGIIVGVGVWFLTSLLDHLLFGRRKA